MKIEERRVEATEELEKPTKVLEDLESEEKRLSGKLKLKSCLSLQLG